MDMIEKMDMMEKTDISTVVENQRVYFNTNATKDISFRKNMLKKLLAIIERYEEDIYEAVFKDLSKSKTETYMAEISIVLTEIKEALKHIERWNKPKKVKGVLSTFPSSNYIYSEPYGVVLILSPWNYPFQLALAPLVGAIASGNCAIVKPSSTSRHTSKLLKKMLDETFDPSHVYCTEVDANNDEVVHQKYDYIFFTGSPRVGKIIMKAASEHLTPVSLELGGKSPCIIDRSADLELAAKRIVWGKFLNAGQTCITIDYILVHDEVKPQFIDSLKRAIGLTLNDAIHQTFYPKIITTHHYQRLINLIDAEKNVYGGERHLETQKIGPTLFTEASFDDVIMEDEIFGPILPIIGYSDLSNCIRTIKERPKPLACYVFTKDKTIAEQVIHEISYGGGCVNDVLLHIANHHLPFGGVGNSGMGGYHGKYSFDTFSHKKSIVKGATRLDNGMRYSPHDNKKFNLLRKLI
ncbi:aldehyde dehydrogenase [Fusibacter bizertensis]